MSTSFISPQTVSLQVKRGRRRFLSSFIGNLMQMRCLCLVLLEYYTRPHKQDRLCLTAACNARRPVVLCIIAFLTLLFRATFRRLLRLRFSLRYSAIRGGVCFALMFVVCRIVRFLHTCSRCLFVTHFSIRQVTIRGGGCRVVIVRR